MVIPMRVGSPLQPQHNKRNPSRSSSRSWVERKTVAASSPSTRFRAASTFRRTDLAAHTSASRQTSFEARMADHSSILREVGRSQGEVEVAWYRPEQWAQLLAIAADREKLRARYENWLASAQRTLLVPVAVRPPL